MAHKPQAQLKRALDEARAAVPVNTSYYHYKHPDQFYTVTGHVIIEADDTVGVVYQAEYGERITFMRPLASWLDTVEHEGKQVPRFQKRVY